jgi:aryl-alcohol dehydrogenase-like predicted oxidoreductase
MIYRNLGSAGVKVSVVGVGCNRFGNLLDREATQAVVHAALDEGINFFDTANVYGNRGGSEEFLGDAVAGRRQEVVLATKVTAPMGDGPNDKGANRYHIMNSVEASLRRLKTDYIDLYQIHSWDDETPIEETMRALDDLVRAGKVRYIGASNFDAWQLCRANAVAELRGWASFVSIQPHYNMLVRDVERELLPYCRYAGLGVLPYFPLAGGFLTGKYQRGQPAPAGTRGESSPYVQRFMTDANFDLLDNLRALADANGRSLVELAVAWLMAQPGTASVIAGATKPEHVSANARAADWTLTDDELKPIRQWLEPAPA